MRLAHSLQQQSSLTTWLDRRSCRYETVDMGWPPRSSACRGQGAAACVQAGALALPLSDGCCHSLLLRAALPCADLGYPPYAWVLADQSFAERHTNSCHTAHTELHSTVATLKSAISTDLRQAERLPIQSVSPRYYPAVHSRVRCATRFLTCWIARWLLFQFCWLQKLHKGRDSTPIS